MSNLTDLLRKRAELEAAIQQAQREARKTALAQIREIATNAGLSADDVASALAGSSAKAEKAVKASKSGAKAAVKFKDENGNTWSGRGLMPRWLKDAVANGKTKESFAVTA